MAKNIKHDVCFIYEILPHIMDAQKANSWGELLELLYPISELICSKVNAEYCSIGLCDGWSLLERDAHIKGKKIRLSDNVNKGDIEHTVVGNFLKQAEYKYWESSKYINRLNRQKALSELSEMEIEELGISKNAFNKKGIEDYEEKFLGEKIVNFTTVRIPSLTNPNDYIGFINIMNLQKFEIAHMDILKEIASLIPYSIQNVFNNIQRNDYEFLANNLFKKSFNINAVVEDFITYISKEFQSDLTTLRIPIETKICGRLDSITYHLRKRECNTHYLANENKRKLDEYFGNDSNKHLSPESIPYHRYLKEGKSDPLVFYTADDYYKEFNFKEFEYEKLFNNNPVLIIPIIIPESSLFDNIWAKCFGVIYMRPKELYNKSIIKARLRNLASVFALMIENSINRERYEQLQNFKIKLNDIKVDNEIDFYRTIAELIRDATGAIETSILIKDTLKNGLELKYSTATLIRVLTNGVEKIYVMEELLNSKVYEFGKDDTCLLRCVGDGEKGDCGDESKINRSLTYLAEKEGQTICIPYLDKFPHCKRFIEIVKDGNSIIISPISINTKIYGVVKCVGKAEHSNSFVNVFCSLDIEFLELLVNIISRFIENRINNQNREEFLNRFRHDVRLPIHALYQSVESITMHKDGNAIPKLIKKCIDVIDVEAKLLSNIYEDIDFIFNSKQEIVLNLKDNCFHEVFDNVKTILKGEALDKNCRIQIHDESNNRIYNRYKFDKNRVVQILINLLRNAIRYSYFGKPVQIGYSQSTDKHIIKVCNTGIGVDSNFKEKMYKLYERGENAKKHSIKGNGIGLYVAKQLAKKLEGDITLEKDDKPTIFTLTLPIK